MKRIEMKEMKYTGNGESELLYYAKDDNGYGIAIVNTRGTHPCGYITFPGIEQVTDYDDFYPGKDDLNDDAFFEINACAHGGYTYLGGLESFGLDGTWIGWDYAHLGDYSGGSMFDRGKKWSTQEIAQCAFMQILMIKSEGFTS